MYMYICNCMPGRICKVCKRESKRACIGIYKVELSAYIKATNVYKEAHSLQPTLHFSHQQPLSPNQPLMVWGACNAILSYGCACIFLLSLLAAFIRKFYELLFPLNNTKETCMLLGADACAIYINILEQLRLYRGLSILLF